MYNNNKVFLVRSNNDFTRFRPQASLSLNIRPIRNFTPGYHQNPLPLSRTVTSSIYTDNTNDSHTDHTDQTDTSASSSSHTFGQDDKNIPETMHSKFAEYSFSKAVMWRQFTSTTSQHFKTIMDTIGIQPKDLDSHISPRCTDQVIALATKLRDENYEYTVDEFMKNLTARTQGFLETIGFDSHFVHTINQTHIGQPNTTLVIDNKPILIGVYTEDNEFPQIKSDDFFFRCLNSSNQTLNPLEQDKRHTNSSIDIVFRTFQYMALNHVTYAFISTSTHTRFLSRDSLCDRILYVSPAIPHNTMSAPLTVTNGMIAICTQAVMGIPMNDKIISNGTYSKPLSFWESFKRECVTRGFALNNSSDIEPLLTSYDTSKPQTMENNNESNESILSLLPVGPASANTSIKDGILHVVDTEENEREMAELVEKLRESGTDNESEDGVDNLKNDDVEEVQLDSFDNFSDVQSEEVYAEATSPSNMSIHKVSHRLEGVEDGSDFVELTANSIHSDTEPNQRFHVRNIMTPPPMLDDRPCRLEKLDEELFYPFDARPAATPTVYSLSSSTTEFPGEIKWWRISRVKRNIHSIHFLNEIGKPDMAELRIIESDIPPESEEDYHRLERNETYKRSVSRTPSNIGHNRIRDLGSRFTFDPKSIANKTPSISDLSEFNINTNLESKRQRGHYGFRHCWVPPIQKKITQYTADIKVIDSSAPSNEKQVAELENEARIIEYLVVHAKDSNNYFPKRYLFGSVMGFLLVLGTEKCGRPVEPHDLVIISEGIDNYPVIELNEEVAESMHNALDAVHSFRILHGDISISNFIINEMDDDAIDHRKRHIRISGFGKSKMYVRLYPVASKEEHKELDRVIEEAVSSYKEQHWRESLENMKHMSEEPLAVKAAKSVETVSSDVQAMEVPSIPFDTEIESNVSSEDMDHMAVEVIVRENDNNSLDIL